MMLGLRVPPAPQPPSGAPGSLQVFRASPGFLRYRLLLWAANQGTALIGLLFALFYFDQSFGLERAKQAPDEVARVLSEVLQLSFLPDGVRFLWDLFEFVAIGLFLAQLPLSFLLISIDYQQRWYMMTDRSLRIREGVWRVDERTMTFSNIQNLTLRQGPLQRLFGISDLEVRSAGGGQSSGEAERKGSLKQTHSAFFHGVANASQIRQTIWERMQGLPGQEDSPEPERLTAAGAARELVAEARALRRAVS